MDVTIQAERLSADTYTEFLRRTDLGSQYPKERFAERVERLVSNVPVSLVARDRTGTILGVLFGITDFAYWLFVTDLGVDRRYTGQGVWTSLMKKALEGAGDEKDIGVYLVANENAIPFYKSLGMKQSGDVMEFNHMESTTFTVE